jgi:nucleoside-diphosphate-sugar epimerase
MRACTGIFPMRSTPFNPQDLLAFYESDAWFHEYAGFHVLVTGAGGFIPSHLVEALLLAGAHVTALVKYNGRGLEGNLVHIPEALRANLKVVQGDVTDASHMRHLVWNKQKVFHLAALIGIPYSYVAPQHYVNTNIQGTLNMLEACREHGVPMVHTSTSETYGSAQYTPIDEAHPLQGQSPYSATKIGADKLVESYARSFELPVATLRPFNTFGPRQSTRAFIPTVIQQALHQGRIEVGSLSPKRDLSPVWDTVRGFMALGAHIEPMAGQVVNIGNGQTQTMGEVLATTLDLMGLSYIPVQENTPARVRPEQSEVLELLSDNTLARTRLGWEPRLSLHQGLDACLAFYQQERPIQATMAYHI